MGYAYINNGVGVSNTSSSSVATGAFNVTNGNLVVVGVAKFSGTVSSVTDNDGHTYSHAGSAGSNIDIYYYVYSADKAGCVVTANFSAPLSYKEIIAVQYSGGESLATVHDTAYAPALNTDAVRPFTTTSSNTAQNDELIVGFFLDTVGGQTYSSSGASTFRVQTSYDDFCCADTITTTAGSLGVAVTGTVDESNSCYAKAFKIPSATVDQEGYRFRNDDGDEATATWIAAQEAGATEPLDTNVRIRFVLNAVGDPVSAGYQLEWDLDGGATWRKVV